MTAPAGGSNPSGRQLSNLQLRILSGTVLAALALWAIWLGGLAFQLLCAASACAVFFEWATMARDRASGAFQALAAVLLVLALVLALGGFFPPLSVAAGAVVLCFLAGVALGAWRWTFAGFCYALLPALALALLRGSGREGFWTILLLFAVVWATDIFAYFVGRAVGGPKLAPAISPGKTWSGAVGGAVAAVVAGLGVSAGAHASHPATIAALSLLLSVVSQIGDLFESWVKRKSGVKDSGRLIPGHGGVMDRVDGLVAAAVTMYGAGVLLSGSLDPAAWLIRP